MLISLVVKACGAIGHAPPACSTLRRTENAVHQGHRDDASFAWLLSGELGSRIAVHMASKASWAAVLVGSKSAIRSAAAPLSLSGSITRFGAGEASRSSRLRTPHTMKHGSAVVREASSSPTSA